MGGVVSFRGLLGFALGIFCLCHAFLRVLRISMSGAIFFKDLFRASRLLRRG